jgi:proline iminopeptidase
MTRQLGCRRPPEGTQGTGLGLPRFCRHDRNGDVVKPYSRLLHDPAVCQRAAEAWCLWESATPDWPPTTGVAKRFQDPAYALAFARIVTHYVSHDLWLDDGVLLREAHLLRDIPSVLINGRYDLQAPLANAWALKRAWPRAELVVVDDASHTAANASIAGAIVRATAAFAWPG